MLFPLLNINLNHLKLNPMKNSTFSHCSLASIQGLSSIRQHHPALSFLEYNRSKPRKDADEIMFQWKKSRSYSIQKFLGSSLRLAMMLFIRLSLYCKVFYGQTSAYAFRAGQPENSSHILHCVLFEKLDVAHWLLYAVPMVPPSYTPVGKSHVD